MRAEGCEIGRQTENIGPEEAEKRATVLEVHARQRIPPRFYLDTQGKRPTVMNSPRPSLQIK